MQFIHLDQLNFDSTMRLTILFCLFFFLRVGKSSVISLSEFENDIRRFKEEDTEVFEDQGLWFLDDNENLVQATFNKSFFSSDNVNLRLNAEKYVFFLLYTKESEKITELFVNDNETLLNSNFNPEKPTRIITHGWINGPESPACVLIRDAFMKQGDYNIIVIDWSSIAKGSYTLASWHVKNIARYVSSMIDFLTSMGMDPKTTILVGHSLGAHVMGLAGHFSVNNLNYIVGLDPALPLFGLATEGSRLSSNDATNVEIIHTNAGFLGFKSDIGDADFFPNGGASQIGCSSDFFGTCSHRRAILFYSESLLSKDGFYAKKCDDYESFIENKCSDEIALMGGLKKKLKSKGKFFLKTREKSPFAIGRNRH